MQLLNYIKNIDIKYFENINYDKYELNGSS